MATRRADLGPASAWAEAVAEGYTGTREDWARALATASTAAQQVAQASGIVTRAAEVDSALQQVDDGLQLLLTWEDGANMIDPAQAVTGRLSAAGTSIGSESTYRTTGWIPVQPMTAYTVKKWDGARWGVVSYAQRWTAYTDKDLSTAIGTPAADAVMEFTTPEGAAYVRFSYGEANQGALCMAPTSSFPAAWADYGRRYSYAAGIATQDELDQAIANEETARELGDQQLWNGIAEAENDAADALTAAEGRLSAAIATSETHTAGMIAGHFDEAALYNVGAYCIGPDGYLYRFTAAHSGEWSASDVVRVSVGSELTRTDTRITTFGGQVAQLSNRVTQIADSMLQADSTLTQAGAAADAKATGDALAAVQAQVDGVQEQIADMNAPVPITLSGAGERGGSISSGLSVGDTIAFTSNSYRRIYSAPINPGETVWIVNCAGGNGTAWPWAIVDSSETIVGLPSVVPNGLDRMTVRITAPDGAAKVYWAVAMRKSIIVREHDSLTLTDGVKSTPSCVSVNATVSAGTETIEGANVNVVEFSADGYVTYPLTSALYINAGVWVKCDYANAGKLTRLGVSLMNGDTAKKTTSIPSDRLKIGEWVFCQVGYLDSVIDGIRLKPVFETGETKVIMRLSPFVVTDRITRPIAIVNFDHAWQATEDCGAYDLLIDNNIPFSITGSIDSVDAETRAKLLDAYAAGLLDIGTYGNESHDGVYYPINTNMADANANLLNLHSIKHSAGIEPVSFGPANHLITLNLLRTIKDNGYKIIRVYGAPEGTNSRYDDSDIIGITETHMTHNEIIVSSNLLYGGVFGTFAHGISANPSAETSPNLYTNYTSFAGFCSGLVDLRALGAVTIMNMRQFADYVMAHKE